jgi:hypothetical protein
VPYKDPLRKREWERHHRSQRIARRRQLRQIETTRRAAQPEELRAQDAAAGILFPVIAGGTLAAYNPKLAMGAGGLTLALAAYYRKSSSWWIVGALILAIGLFFQWNNQNVKHETK